MRHGSPLPGTPPPKCSQLTHRVFGPLQPTRTRIVLDYHGLQDHPRWSGRHRHHHSPPAPSPTTSPRLRRRCPDNAAPPTGHPGDPAVHRFDDHLRRVRIANHPGSARRTDRTLRGTGTGAGRAPGGGPGRHPRARDRTAGPPRWPTPLPEPGGSRTRCPAPHTPVTPRVWPGRGTAGGRPQAMAPR